MEGCRQGGDLRDGTMKKANWAISLCTDLITVCVPYCLNVFETQRQWAMEDRATMF